MDQSTGKTASKFTSQLETSLQGQQQSSAFLLPGVGSPVYLDSTTFRKSSISLLLSIWTLHCRGTGRGKSFIHYFLDPSICSAETHNFWWAKQRTVLTACFFDIAKHTNRCIEMTTMLYVVCLNFVTKFKKQNEISLFYVEASIRVFCNVTETTLTQKLFCSLTRFA